MPLGRVGSLQARAEPSHDVAFTIVGSRLIERGGLRASFSVAVRGVGRIDALLFDGSHGPFVSSASTCDKSGAYRSTVAFSPDFATTLCDAALAIYRARQQAALKAPATTRKPSAIARSRSVRRRAATRKAAVGRASLRKGAAATTAILASQEDAFDNAVERFDNGGDVA